MQVIPTDILEQYSAILKKRAVPLYRYADYRKWLRYFLDFRCKHPMPESRSEQVRLFVLKLREKKQSPEQQKQAVHALSLFFESQPRLKPGTAKPASINQKFSNIQVIPADISVSRLKSNAVDNHVHNDENRSTFASPAQGEGKNKRQGHIRESHYNDWRSLRQSDSPAWDKIIESLAAEIKMRH
jgi:hypothetical protein